MTEPLPPLKGDETFTGVHRRTGAAGATRTAPVIASPVAAPMATASPVQALLKIAPATVLMGTDARTSLVITSEASSGSVGGQSVTEELWAGEESDRGAVPEGMRSTSPMRGDDGFVIMSAAVREHQWGVVVDLLEKRWFQDVHQRGRELLEILERLPESVLDERPRWIRSRDFLRSQWGPVARKWREPVGPVELTARIVELRRAGLAREAMPAVAECRALLAGIPFGVDAGVDAARAELHYQWARALEDVGATREACREYESAARLADLTPRPGRMRSLAGGAAAFLSALHGHRGQAERILREFCDGGAEPLGGGVSAALARAQLSFDELDRDTARRIMSEIDVVSVEHRWAHYLRTLALVEWEQQRPHRLAAELDSRLRALSSRALTGMTADAVRITEYLRAAAAGRRDLAHAALGSATATGTVLEQLVTALRALDFTRIGRSEDARRLVASLRAASLVPRTELLTLVAAPERSDADLARITDLAVEYRLYWLLSALPENEHRAVTARIAEREGTVVPVERREPALAVCASALSERERDVAERAALRERTSDIAAALFVSANTVKTQLRSIYRKLDVSTRDELYDALKGLAREVSLTE